MTIKFTMGLDLQPDGLTAGLAGHCQPDKNIHSYLYIADGLKNMTISFRISCRFGSYHGKEHIH